MRLLRTGMTVAVACVAAVVPAGGSGAATTQRLALVKVAGGLRAPVDLAVTPSERDRLYVVEQRGLVRVVERGKLLPRPFLDVRRLVRAKELAGLFSLAFDPAYGRSRRLVVAYVGRDLDLHVVRYRSRAGVALPRTAEELLHVEMPTKNTNNHFGGDLAFGPDGLLYVGVGDGSTPAAAQDPESLLGKLVRLDARAAAPAPEVVALGLRNPWRFSFDRATGDLYVGDVGASRWEEIDYVQRGDGRPHNFGWPAYEGRVRRAATSPPLDPAPTPPLFVYRHAARGCSSVVGGYVYRGRRVPELRGRYVFADFCSAEIRSLRVARGKAGDVRTELSRRLPGLLSSFGEDNRGELYAFAYTYELSTLYRLDEAG